MSSKLDEMTGCAAIPAIDGAGLSFQPKPARDLKKGKKKRTAVSSLLGEDADDIEPMVPEAEVAPIVSTPNDEPEFDPNQTVAVMRGGDTVNPGEVLALEVDREYAEWRIIDNNAIPERVPARIVSNEEARKALGYADKPVEPEPTPTPVAEVPVPTAEASVAKPAAKPIVESGPTSLRDFWNPGETRQSINSLTPATLNEATAAGLAASMLQVAPAQVESAAPVAAGFGESLMRGGVLPPPEVASDPNRLAASVHAYLA